MKHRMHGETPRQKTMREMRERMREITGEILDTKGRFNPKSALIALCVTVETLAEEIYDIDRQLIDD